VTIPDMIFFFSFAFGALYCLLKGAPDDAAMVVLVMAAYLSIRLEEKHDRYR